MKARVRLRSMSVASTQDRIRSRAACLSASRRVLIDACRG
jgi:hypothetical protein